MIEFVEFKDGYRWYDGPYDTGDWERNITAVDELNKWIENNPNKEIVDTWYRTNYRKDVEAVQTSILIKVKS